MGSNPRGGRETRILRICVGILLIGAILSSGVVGSVEASCQDDFENCTGTLDPLKDSGAALNTLAWTVLSIGGPIVSLGGVILYVSSRTGTRMKKKAKGAIIGGIAMLFLYFARNVVFGLIDYIVGVQ